MLRTAGALAALIGVGLLVADVVLPVPASLVMLGRVTRLPVGALLGPMAGAALSLLGG